MTTKRQLVVSALMLGAAVAIVVLVTRSGEAGEALAGGQEHDMAAMSMGASSTERNPVALDQIGRDRIGVTFATVERRELPVVLRTVGTVAYDETRLTTVSLKVEGWIETLYVDFTGAPVGAGDPLLEVYSPMLVTAQEELVLAAKLVERAGSERAAQNARELLESARRRLAYWDIGADEIRRIEESREPTKTMTLKAPASGIVVEKNVVNGDRIMPGMTLYRIADLSRVWIEAEVFEKDLALVREGQAAEAEFEAYPGRMFSSRVAYVYPTVSVQSRTARVRLEIANPDLALKPGMYASVQLEAPRLPATPVVPSSAVIQTGERALVFVSSADGRLLPRNVTVGRTSGRYTQILSGLEAGEEVVSSAAFLIDAESNLGTMIGTEGAPVDGEGMEGMVHDSVGSGQGG